MGTIDDEARITHHEHCISVKTDWDKVYAIKDMIDEKITSGQYITADCLTALCMLSVELAYSAHIGKPHFLAKLSMLWEVLDGQVIDRQQGTRE